MLHRAQGVEPFSALPGAWQQLNRAALDFRAVSSRRSISQLFSRIRPFQRAIGLSKRQEKDIEILAGSCHRYEVVSCAHMDEIRQDGHGQPVKQTIAPMTPYYAALSKANPQMRRKRFSAAVSALTHKRHSCGV